jgi:hypothetical protein
MNTKEYTNINEVVEAAENLGLYRATGTMTGAGSWRFNDKNLHCAENFSEVLYWAESETKDANLAQEFANLYIQAEEFEAYE